MSIRTSRTTLSVALTEACANAVEHGGDAAPGTASEAYRVTAYLDGEKCRIEVSDRPGFAPGRARPRSARSAATRSTAGGSA